MKIIAFGPLTDIVGGDSFEVPWVPDTEALKLALQRQFPALETATFLFAVDKQVVTGVAGLEVGSEVALLPPFSGG